MVKIFGAQYFQVGFVTSNYNEMEARLRATFQVPSFFMFPEVELKALMYRGKQAKCVANVAIGYSGDTQIEIVQPVEGNDLYSDFLSAGGNGLHHVGLQVKDFEVARTEALSVGRKIEQEGVVGEDGGIRFAFLDTFHELGCLTELVSLSPEVEKLYRRLRERAMRAQLT